MCCLGGEKTKDSLCETGTAFMGQKRRRNKDRREESWYVVGEIKTERETGNTFKWVLQ